MGRSGPLGQVGDAAAPARLVEHFFRHETGRLHGALVRLMGVENLALAEDVAQETMIRAMTTWSMGGVPPNPSAWIMRTAMNLARDTLRHRRMASGKETAMVAHFERVMTPDPEPGREQETIRDDALRLLFVCCHPQVAADAQVILALKVLCGFGTGEIARAFFCGEAAIDKQLVRTKQRIRDAGIPFEIPEGADLDVRLDGVLATLYLLFNEGYKASSGDLLLREDLCREAIRLGRLLVSHPAGDRPRAHALLALMLLTAARFPARVGEHGDLLRLEDQDRSRWDPALIGEGLSRLADAARGDELGEYHLQAGIAACHGLAPDYASTDWPRILRHYDALYRIRPSPVVALNRAVALANVSGPRAGLEALATIPERSRLESHHLLHAVAGELHRRLGDPVAAAESFRTARRLAQVGPEQDHLTRMLTESEDNAPGILT